MYTHNFEGRGSSHKHSTVYYVCDTCSNKQSFISSQGVINNWQDEALMQHEGQHALDWCAGISNRTEQETRAYALFNLKQGKAKLEDYISALRKSVDSSTYAQTNDLIFHQTLVTLGIIK